MSVTYTTAHGNVRSLNHWAGPGIEPVSPWILVGFVSAVPHWELLISSISKLLERSSMPLSSFPTHSAMPSTSLNWILSHPQRSLLLNEWPLLRHYLRLAFDSFSLLFYLLLLFWGSPASWPFPPMIFLRSNPPMPCRSWNASGSCLWFFSTDFLWVITQPLPRDPWWMTLICDPSITEVEEGWFLQMVGSECSYQEKCSAEKSNED